jgi:hypothetical protein
VLVRLMLVRFGESLGDDRRAGEGARPYRGADEELAARFIMLAHIDFTSLSICLHRL